MAGESDFPSFGCYRIDALLGQGGMGVVYRAFDTRLKRVVAIKAIRRTLFATSGGRARFIREAQSLAKIKHPNVARIFAVEADADPPYFVQEFIDGRDLSRVLEEDGVLCPS